MGGVGLGVYSATKSVLPLGALVALSTAGAAFAFGKFLDGRLRLREVIDARTVVLVALAGGVVGQAIVQLERLFPKVPKVHLVIVAVGPIEEMAKLAVPLLLYAWGRKKFRDPRVGLATVLASAAAFAVAESVTYALRAAHTHKIAMVAATTLAKPPLDPFLHMCLTGIVGAMVWRAWHLRGGFRLTRGVVGVTLLAMALHSLNDALGLFVRVPLVGDLMVVAIYLVFKDFARRDVPPGAIAHVPPRWRPAHLASAATAPVAGVGSGEVPAVREAAATEAAATE